MFQRFLALLLLIAVALKLRRDEGEELTEHELAHLDAALGSALREDGSTDIERLMQQSHSVDIDDLRREKRRAKPSVASSP